MTQSEQIKYLKEQLALKDKELKEAYERIDRAFDLYAALVIIVDGYQSQQQPATTTHPYPYQIGGNPSYQPNPLLRYTPPTVANPSWVSSGTISVGTPVHINNDNPSGKHNLANVLIADSKIKNCS